jgi:hypothetical protein
MFNCFAMNHFNFDRDEDHDERLNTRLQERTIATIMSKEACTIKRLLKENQLR